MTINDHRASTPAPQVDHPDRLRALHDAGVSIWLDNLSRDLLETGGLADMIDSCSVTGVTSNPTIFANAIGGSDRYDHQLRTAVGAGISDPQELFFDLALEDVRRAADLLLDTHRASNGRDGFVSMECTPDLAHDASGTTTQAISLWDRLARPNVLIKVPATDAGIVAIEELTLLGLNVNVTLLFSIARYEQAAEAYMRGIERRLATGASVAHVTSVASFFVSRVDAKVDALLPPGSELRGRIAVANAQRAYSRCTDIFDSPRWRTLEAAGARRQRPLWASTATKNPAYPDLLYVEELVLPGTINTMPITTLSAFSSHGRAAHALGDSASEVLDAAARVLDLDVIAADLEREGVRAFSDSYDQLLARIESKAPEPASAPG